MGLLATEVIPFRESLLNSRTTSEPFSDDGHKKPVDVSELVENEHRLILIGEAGSGKSTTLRWLAKEYGRKYREGKSNNVPLYVDLADCSSEGSFEENILKLSKLSGEALQLLTNEKRLFIVFDGLDNFSGDIAGLKQFIIQSKECRIVISSRPGFSSYIESSLKWKTANLNPLSKPEERRKFINKYLPGEENAQLRQELYDKIEKNNAKLRDLCKIPLLFYMVICVAADPRRRNRANFETIPNTRAELYEYFISNLTDHARASGRIKNDIGLEGIVDQILPCLFFHMQCENSIKIKIKDVFDLNTPYKLKIGEVLEISREMGLLVERDKMLHIGLHQSFQEYYAAIRLTELFEKNIDVTPAFTHPKWEDVVVMASEMVSDPDKFIDQIMAENLFLAAKCLKTASDETKDELLNLLCKIVEETRFEFESMLAIEAIASLGLVGVESLIRLISGNINNSCSCAIDNIGEIGSEEIVSALIGVLKNKDNDFEIWDYVASHLGYLRIRYDIPAGDVIQVLIEAMKDKSNDSNIRSSAVSSIGWIGSQDAVSALIEVWNDKDDCIEIRWETLSALYEICSWNDDPEIQWNAASTLAGINLKDAFSTLIEVLKDKDDAYLIEWHILFVLDEIGLNNLFSTIQGILEEKIDHSEIRWSGVFGEIGSKHCVSVLIDILKEKLDDPEIWWEGIPALVGISLKDAVPVLVGILNDTNNYSDVRLRAVNLIGQFGSENAVLALTEAMNDRDNDSEIRGVAARSLGKIGSKDAVPALIEAMNDGDNDSEIRGVAASSLGKIGSKDAVPALIEAMNDRDNDSEIRGVAASSLGDIGSKDAVPALIEALTDMDLKRAIIFALGRIGLEDAVPALIKAMNDRSSDSDIWESAARSLGEIGSEDAVPALIEVLNERDDRDNDSEIRCYAGIALRMIGSEDAVSALVRVLTDRTEDYRIRKDAAFALREHHSFLNKELLNDLKNDDDLLIANTGYDIISAINHENNQTKKLFGELKLSCNR